MSDIEKVYDKNKRYVKKLGIDYNLLYELLNVQIPVRMASKEFVDAVKAWQRLNKLDDDGVIGPNTWTAMEMSTLTYEERVVARLINEVAVFESGGDYGAMALDVEFRGLVNRAWNKRHGKDHPAYNTCHIGVSAGIIQMTQDGGTLGKYLARCAKKNPSKFKLLIGPTWQELLSVVTAKGKPGFRHRPRKLRGPRVQKIPVSVDGHMERRDLWESPWKDKLKKVLLDPEFKQVQREIAYEVYLKPIMKYLEENGITSEKCVATAFNIAVHAGVGRVDDWMDVALKEVKDIMNPDSDEDDRIVMKRVAKKYHRAKSILDNDRLSYDRWEGFDLNI